MILVVDDEASVREVCQRTLAGMECVVETAEGAEPALAKMRDHPFDLVLTDLTMPGPLNGEKLLEEIKCLYPSTDVIIMTAFPALDTAIPTLKKGAYDYLIKPFDQSFLKASVGRWQEKRQLSDDLSYEKTLRQDLEAAYRQLQEMEQIKEAFLARVNHELRMPLVPAFMALDILKGRMTDEHSQSLCSLLDQRLTRLQDVIEQLLLFADVRQPSFQGSRRILDLPNLLRQTVEKYRLSWQERSLTVHLEAEPSSRCVWGDEGLVSTAFKHLFLNAIKFSKEKGRISLVGKVLPEGYEIRVSDDGEGIPADKMNKIFDGFYQVAYYMTRQAEGLGLGLAIVQRVMNLHGATISVTSAADQGTTFTLRFPFFEHPPTANELIAPPAAPS
jgi:signal transduction histidine kinase